MKLLWDMRLFSFGYATRGVGVYTTSVALNFLRENRNIEIIIWGDKNFIPKEIIEYASKIIPYKPSNWKLDFVKIPYLIIRYNIEIIHYWISLGPIRISMGPNLSCKIIATVYDLSIENWNEIPTTAALKKSLYWKFQKRLLNNSNTIITISEATANNLKKLNINKNISIKTIYPPLPKSSKSLIKNRKNNFVTLGGAENKNLSSVIESFTLFSKTNLNYTLTIYGTVLEKELPNILPKNIFIKPYKYYKEDLFTAIAFISLSTHEGLGLPVIEAMSCSTPLILSTIPSYYEIANGSAIFCNSIDIKQVTLAFDEIISKNNYWIEKSLEAYTKYQSFSNLSNKIWDEIYSN